MAAGVLLAQGNLPVAANELQRGGVGWAAATMAGLCDRSATKSMVRVAPTEQWEG
jgi:hypothetical protein